MPRSSSSLAILPASMPVGQFITTTATDPGNNTSEFSACRIVTEPPVLTVDIDIKPGSDPNSINCKNEKRVIAVAILIAEDFDATIVDHSTVFFEGTSETDLRMKSGEPRRHEEVVDGDGDTHLVFHFRLRDTRLTCSSTEGTLTGETFDSQATEGTDAVRMVGG